MTTPYIKQEGPILVVYSKCRVETLGDYALAARFAHDLKVSYPELEIVLTSKEEGLVQFYKLYPKVKANFIHIDDIELPFYDIEKFYPDKKITALIQAGNCLTLDQPILGRIIDIDTCLISIMGPHHDLDKHHSYESFDLLSKFAVYTGIGSGRIGISRMMSISSSEMSLPDKPYGFIYPRNASVETILQFITITGYSHYVLIGDHSSILTTLRQLLPDGVTLDFYEYLSQERMNEWLHNSLPITFSTGTQSTFNAMSNHVFYYEYLTHNRGFVKSYFDRFCIVAENYVKNNNRIDLVSLKGGMCLLMYPKPLPQDYALRIKKLLEMPGFIEAVIIINKHIIQEIDGKLANNFWQCFTHYQQAPRSISPDEVINSLPLYTDKKSPTLILALERAACTQEIYKLKYLYSLINQGDLASRIELINTLCKVVQWKKVFSLQALISLGVSVDCVNTYGKSPFELAISNYISHQEWVYEEEHVLQPSKLSNPVDIKLAEKTIKKIIKILIYAGADSKLKLTASPYQETVKKCVIHYEKKLRQDRAINDIPQDNPYPYRNRLFFKPVPQIPKVCLINDSLDTSPNVK